MSVRCKFLNSFEDLYLSDYLLIIKKTKKKKENKVEDTHSAKIWDRIVFISGKPETQIKCIRIVRFHSDEYTYLLKIQYSF